MATGKGRVYSVAQVNAYIRNMFDQDFLLTAVSVRGEISNCKYHQSGHVYFTLKDAGAAMACVLFAGNRRNVSLRLRDGMQVIASGKVSVYEKGGTYQLYVSAVSAAGLGELYERYEALKKELMEMGMFDALYKQPIPRHVRTLGVVTAPTGAAVRDIIQISGRRNPGIQIILYPARVQGDGAVESIVRGIRLLDAQGVDVIIIGRGGGSIEDLWAFNEEAVARAVFEAATPIISAVGHETDTVITDFVADLRAPTPSAAAELAVEDLQLTLDRLKSDHVALQRGMLERLQTARTQIQMRAVRLNALHPGAVLDRQKDRLRMLRDTMNACVSQAIAERRMDVMNAEERLRILMERRVEAEKQKLALYAQRLQGASPYRVLAAGYSLVTDAQGRRLSSIEDSNVGDALKVYLQDGFLKTEVTGKQGRPDPDAGIVGK